MSEFDRRKSGDNGESRGPGAHEPTPGKHTNTEFVGSGVTGPLPNVPGKRAATESLAYAESAKPAEGVRPARSALPYHAAIQRAFGHHDVTGVQVEIGGAAAADAGAIDAKAFTTGNRIMFAAEPDLHTAAHEAAHVVHQRAGVAPEGGIDGGANDRYEQHADAVADAVVRGESAEALLDQVAGRGANAVSAQPTVQRKAVGARATSEGSSSSDLPVGKPYEVAPGGMSVRVSRVWLHEQPYQRYLELLQAMHTAGAVPWAKPDDLERLAGRSEPPSPTGSKLLHFTLDVMALSIVGLPPTAEPVIERIGGAFVIAIPVPGLVGLSDQVSAIDLESKQLETVYRALSKYTGLAVRTRPELSARVQGRDTVILAVGEHLLEQIFGTTAWDRWNRRQTEKSVDHVDGKHAAPKATTDESSVGTPPEGSEVAPQLTPAERARTTNWLEEIGAGPSTPVTRELLAIIDELDADPKLAPAVKREILRQLRARPDRQGRPVTATLLREAIDRAKLELERARLGLGAAPLAHQGKDVDPAGVIDVPARLVQRGLLLSGHPAHFDVVLDWSALGGISAAQRDALANRPWHATVEWVFERTDVQGPQRHDGAPIAATETVRTEHEHNTIGIDRTFRLGASEARGTWAVHAFVHTSHFAPKQVVASVEVKTEAARMTDLRREAMADLTPDRDRSVTPHQFDLGKRNAFAAPVRMPGQNDLDAEGEVTRGTLPPGFHERTPAERAINRQTEILQTIALVGYLNGQRRDPTHDNTDAIAAAERRLAHLQEADKKIADDTNAGWQSFELRGTYLSRNAEVASGPLDLYGSVQRVRDTVLGSQVDRGVAVQIRDHSQRLGAENFQFSGEGKSFEEALESAFVDLSKMYPEGKLGVMAQEMSSGTAGKPGAIHPTGKAIGFELATTSSWKRLKAKLYNPVVQTVINVAATALMVFQPETAAIIMPLLTAQNTVSNVDELISLHDTGKLSFGTASRTLLQIGLDFLPYARSARFLQTGGRLVAFEAANYVGMAVVMTLQAREQIAAIQEQQIAGMAERYRALVELEKTANPSDPEFAQRRAEIEQGAQVIRTTTQSVWSEVIGQNGLFLIGTHMLHHVQRGRVAGADKEWAPGHLDAIGDAPAYEPEGHTPRAPRSAPGAHEPATTDSPSEHHADTNAQAAHDRTAPAHEPSSGHADESLSKSGGASGHDAPGAPASNEVQHLGLQLANIVGDARYDGEGIFRIALDRGELDVEVKRTRAGAVRVVHRDRWVVLEVPVGLADVELQRVVVGKLTELRHEALRRARGEHATAESGLGEHGIGQRLSPQDMGMIAELRVLRVRRAEQAERGAAGEQATQQIDATIDALETRMGLRGGSAEANQRRRAVEVQVEVQNDTARRDRTRRELEGEHGHPGIELHNHFLGIVDAEAFRKRAATATGGKDSGSWVPLLERIKELRGTTFRHEHDPSNAHITKRATAGDAVEIADGAWQQVETLRERAQKSTVEADKAAFSRAAEAVAEEACQTALRATPETDFNSAYEIRDELVKQTFGGGAKPSETADAGKQRAYDDYIREAVLQLAADGVGYSEQSASLKKLAGVLSPERIEGVIRQLIAEGKLVAGQVDIRMLGMTQTRHFGERAPELPPVASPDRSDAAFEGDLHAVKQQIRHPGTVGADVGGPELFTFDDKGKARFQAVYREFLAEATRTGTQAVFRPHVGEGAVDTVAGKPFNTDADRHVTSGEPSHYPRARDNIEAMLSSLEQLKADGVLDPAKVIVRLGHFTHATPEHVARLKALGVISEVLLGSNVATGALSQTRGVHGTRSPVEQLDDHSFPTHLFYDAPIAIGTDAGAVMSTSLRAEYQRAHQMIEEVLAGTRPIQIRAEDARLGDTGYRGHEVPGHPELRELSVTDLTPDERGRFLHGYEKLYADAERYYRRRPKPRGTVGNPTTAASPNKGAHHVGIAGDHGLVPSKGTAIYEGTRSDVDAAARAYRGAGYFVSETAKAGDVIIVEVRSADGDFETTLRSWTGDGPAYLPVNDRGVLDRGVLDQPRTNNEIRRWYKDQLQRIASLDDGWLAGNIPLEERARRAHEIRRHARRAAREQMQVSGEVASLEVRDLSEYGDGDGPSFESLVEEHTNKGMTRDQAFEAIIGSSRRSNTRYDRRHGVGEDKR